MAANLRKYRYEAQANHRPSAASAKSSDKAEHKSPKSDTTASMDPSAIKADVLISLRNDIASIIKEEVKAALAEDFATLRREIQDTKTEISRNTAAMRAEVDNVKANMAVMEEGLSAWSDKVVAMQQTVTTLETQVSVLKEKNEDLEGRMRRSNIRIVGVPELQGSSTPETISSLLKEVFQLDKDIRVDRSHRSLIQRKTGDKPRAIIARLNSEGDAQDIIRRARNSGGRLRFRGNPISIFPDYTSSVVKARAAFTDVRRVLRNRPGVRYGIFFPARLRITYNDVQQEFVDATKAMDYVNAKIPPPPEDVSDD